MSRSLNKVMLIGNVGNDPEIRATSGGTKVAKFLVATSRYAKPGEKAGTDWHRITVFGKLVDVVERYVRKGDRLYVEGRIEYSKTEGDGGSMIHPKYWTDVVANELLMLGVKSDDTGPTKKAAAGNDADTLPF